MTAFRDFKLIGAPPLLSWVVRSARGQAMELRAVSPEDAQAIAALVQGLPDIQQPILLICGEDHDRAVVYLGRVDGPLAGGGAAVEVRREQGGWVVAGVGCWVA